MSVGVFCWCPQVSVCLGCGAGEGSDAHWLLCSRRSPCPSETSSGISEQISLPCGPGAFQTAASTLYLCRPVGWAVSLSAGAQLPSWLCQSHAHWFVNFQELSPTYCEHSWKLALLVFKAKYNWDLSSAHGSPMPEVPGVGLCLSSLPGPQVPPSCEQSHGST